MSLKVLMKQKLNKYDKVINKIVKLTKVDKEKLTKKLLEPDWFEKFYYYGFDLSKVLEKDQDILQKLKKEISK
jgi:hypothetical protein